MRPLKLSIEDQNLARDAADSFIQWSVDMNKTDKPHTRAVPWKSDHERKWEMQMAYAAEIAIARLLDLPWNGLNTFKDVADVGDNVEVRWSRSENLILRTYDRDQDLAFLVQGPSIDKLFFAGFYPVKMGRTLEFKHPTENTWFIPRARLYRYVPENEALKRFWAFWSNHIREINQNQQ